MYISAPIVDFLASRFIDGRLRGVPRGVAVMALKARRTLVRAGFLKDSHIQNVARYRVRSLPAAGALLRPEDREEQQMSLIEE